MELKFKYALFAAGATLIFIGLAALAVNVLSNSPNPGMVDSISRGFDTIFLALFSGVLMGIGIALVGNGFVLHSFGSKKHIFVTMLFSILFLALATLAIFFRASSPLLGLVGFFAFISASGAFLLTGVWYVLSNVARKYLVDLG